MPTMRLASWSPCRCAGSSVDVRTAPNPRANRQASDHQLRLGAKGSARTRPLEPITLHTGRPPDSPGNEWHAIQSQYYDLNVQRTGSGTSVLGWELGTGVSL